MSDDHLGGFDVEAVSKAEPFRTNKKVECFLWGLVLLGAFAFGLGLIIKPKEHLWSVYLVNLLVFMGLATGSVAITAIFQIVRARWSASIIRIAEAGVAFLPWAFVLWLLTYFGQEALYPWATAEMPGREWWMQPDFVFGRFVILLALLFWILWRFVRINLRADIGYLRSRQEYAHNWSARYYQGLVKGWQGDEEIVNSQRKRTFMAPLVIIAYCVITSLFAFEMVMSIDFMWYANMYGGFIFVGNIYMAWAMLGLTITLICWKNKTLSNIVTQDQFWDLGKMTFAFCMLWAYMFWAQFLPQWYGNLPEETQWLIVRTREFPWKGWAWVVFPLGFIIPFITLLSRDVKRVPVFFSVVAVMIIAAVWGEKYLFVVPQFYPQVIPFGWLEIGVTCGFLGAYVLSIRHFLSCYPIAIVGNPLAKGDNKW